MDAESQDQLPASKRLAALSVRVLVKTVLKSALWLGIAWGITHFFPTAAWAWYVAFAFIAIGLIFSLAMFLAAIRAAKAEQQEALGGRE
jgi:cyanate permease